MTRAQSACPHPDLHISPHPGVAIPLHSLPTPQPTTHTAPPTLTSSSTRCRFIFSLTCFWSASCGGRGQAKGPGFLSDNYAIPHGVHLHITASVCRYQIVTCFWSASCGSVPGTARVLTDSLLDCESLHARLCNCTGIDLDLVLAHLPQAAICGMLWHGLAR